MVLRVANFGSAGNVFGVSRLSHVIRHDCILAALSRLSNRRNHIFAIRRKRKVRHALASGNVERLALLTFFALLLLLFTLLSLLAHGVEQRPLFLLQVLLAVSSLRCRARHRRRPDANVRKLLDRSTIERHHVKIVQPREVDPFLIESEVRIRFRVDGLCDLSPRLLRMIVDEDVALVREDCHRLVFRQLTSRGRRQLRFFIS